MPSLYKTILHKAVGIGASAVLISTAFPVFAFAEGGKNITDEGKSIILAESTDGTSKGIKWPDGKWVETEQERSEGIYKWSTYIRGDNSHYGHYDVTLTFEISDNELKRIDLSSLGTTFGGRWGVLTPHDGASRVIGFLPEKINDATTVDKETKTVFHKLENAQVYGGITYSDITVLKNDGVTEVGTLTYSAGGKGKTAVWTSTPAEGVSSDFASFDDAAGTLTVNDDDAAVVRISEKIGDYYVFSQYYGLTDEGEAIAETLTNENKTDFNKEVSGIGAKDRDVYTAAAYNLIVRQQ
ncbi:MAG: hypothetical protein IJV62_04575, partial [Eggerthellaceae bacterium]|nr:hypothetical protein [Eggerthellaceae bacterium]